MTIGQMITQGFGYARTCKSLWLFGFVVGVAAGGNGGVGVRNTGNAAGSAGGGLGMLWALYPSAVASLVALAVVAIVAGFIIRFVSEGALIEGVVRARQGGRMTIREGMRAGWAHWGVLVRIALLYAGATLASVGLVVGTCVVATRTLGLAGALMTGIPALVVMVPWLVTLYLVQAFASRIAVLENRRALDAIGKARIFLHGRLTHGLKLIAASFIGSLGIGVLTIAVLLPTVLLLVALIPWLRVLPVVVLAVAVLAPTMYVLAAVLGVFRSSVWTIGYLTQVES